MYLEIVTLSEVIQTEKDCMTALICGIYQKTIQMNLFTNRCADLEKQLKVARGKNGGKR